MQTFFKLKTLIIWRNKLTMTDINAVKLDEECLSYADVSLANDPDLTIDKINKL